MNRLIVLLALFFTLAADRPPPRPEPPPESIPTPFPTAVSESTSSDELLENGMYVPLIMYPWQYGWVCGTLLKSGTDEPFYGVAGIGKVWCDSTGKYCVWLWDEAWSPRSWTDPNTGDFCIDTHVAYAPGVWDEPYDGGIGDFVIFATTNGSFIEGYWQRVNYKITVYPNEISDAGILYTDITKTVPTPSPLIEPVEQRFTGDLDS